MTGISKGTHACTQTYTRNPNSITFAQTTLASSRRLSVHPLRMTDTTVVPRRRATGNPQTHITTTISRITETVMPEHRPAPVPPPVPLPFLAAAASAIPTVPTVPTVSTVPTVLYTPPAAAK